MSTREYTPLNISQSRVLAVMRLQGLEKTVPKMIGEKEKRNTHLYCEYHRDFDNEIEDCQDLKEEIESLVG